MLALSLQMFSRVRKPLLFEGAALINSVVQHGILPCPTQHPQIQPHTVRVHIAKDLRLSKVSPVYPLSVAVIKHRDQKQLKEERILFWLTLPMGYRLSWYGEVMARWREQEQVDHI